ncbi:double-stranded DNA-binding domain-containing protein, putative [Eimeria maxima]|uniref:Double-stranded DNA-binding domain-containing protein, putative n=1 Tax=Eimeria maxima TaxID=5804 RepID=U6MBR9_EIMMA|nr:double-stranded DNA-binding domain-containing protein, putative [Eimeria maxima]CDJ59090.1 double-stranded DNA-binding domain-containing protein, putative [Eimeria maxima]
MDPTDPSVQKQLQQQMQQQQQQEEKRKWGSRGAEEDGYEVTALARGARTPYVAGVARIHLVKPQNAVAAENYIMQGHTYLCVGP